MNARKRSGDTLSQPPRKQPRLTMRAVDGGNPSPGGTNAVAGQRLRARWVAHFTTGLKNGFSFIHGTAELVYDSIFSASQDAGLPMYSSTENTTPALPAAPRLPSSSHSEAQDSLPAEDTPPITPSPPAAKPSAVMRPQPVPWPSTANTQTHYPQVDKEFRNSVRRQHKRATRQHIFAKKHKMHVQAAVAGAREDLLKELYILQQRNGYSSDFATFKGFMKKQALIKRYMRSRSSSLTDLSRQTRAKSEDVETDFLRRAIEKAQATLNGPKPLQPLTPSINQLQFRYRSKDNELEQRLRRPSLPSSLPPEDDAKVTSLLEDQRHVSKFAREQVTNEDLRRLNPNKWLNDEIINFYGALILARSEASKENPGKDAKGKKKALDVHYFSTFFWTKLEKEGYDKGRLAKWTKKIDIFSKDTILIPVNHGNVHWTGAAINFRQKRIESYDSMHDERGRVFKLLRQYVDLEHRNKRKTPFDFTGWEDHTSAETPRQENGFDCGVFTCQFLESLSRGEEKFNFVQKDIPYLRRRMIWEIGNGQLRTEH